MTLSRAISEASFRGALAEVFTAAGLSMRLPAAFAQAVGARCRGEPAPALEQAIPDLPSEIAAMAGAVCEALAAGAPEVLPVLVPRSGSIEAELGHIVHRRDELRVLAVAPGMSRLFDREAGHRIRIRLDFEAAAIKP
jgi:hypothetical protein